LYSHRVVLPSEAQILTGSSPAKYRSTAIALLQKLLFHEHLLKGLGVHDKAGCGYSIVKERL
jgi:hypothetical protein